MSLSLGTVCPLSGDADGADLWPNNHGFAMAATGENRPFGMPNAD
jgi:hypothetical protein